MQPVILNNFRIRMQRHPMSKRRVPIAVNRLDCFAYEQLRCVELSILDSITFLIYGSLIDCVADDATRKYAQRRPGFTSKNRMEDVGFLLSVFSTAIYLVFAT